MNKWLVLLGYVLTTYANAILFGIYSDNISQFASYYQSSTQEIVNLQYVGLIIEVLLCVPVIRLIEWRLDYCIITACYLSVCAGWLCYFSIRNIVTAYASLALNSFAQLFILPTSFYLPEVWFPLEQRSIAINFGFYSNLLGFATGGIITSLVVTTQAQVKLEALIVAVVNSVSLLATLFLVRNKPDNKLEQINQVSKKHLRVLWRHKFMAYNTIALSAFLGVSWGFLDQFKEFKMLFNDSQVAGLMIVWIFSGGLFGIFLPRGVRKLIEKSGNYILYDSTCKLFATLGLLGFLALGVILHFKVATYAIFVGLMIWIGIGSVGFFGLTFLALIESLYPVPVLLIGTIIAASASIYSIMSLTIHSIFPSLNYSFCNSIVLALPLLYILISYQTNFKRYKYYLNEKETKFELLRVKSETIEQQKQN